MEKYRSNYRERPGGMTIDTGIVDFVNFEIIYIPELQQNSIEVA